MLLFQRLPALVLSCLFAVSLLSLTPRVQAASGTWNNNTNTNSVWSNTGSWVGGIVADGATFTADFSALNITGTRTINLDSSRTIGTLKLGDATTTSNSYILSSSNSSLLTFDNGASDALLQALVSSNGDTISVGLRLNSSLTISNAMNSSRVLTLSGGLSASSAGAKTLANVGAGSGITLISGIISDGGAGGTIAVSTSNTNTAGGLTLGGNNSHSGGTTLTSGVLNVNHVNALGTGALTIAGGTLDNKSGGVLLLGGNILQNWNGSFTYTGSNSMNMGGGTVTLGANVTATVSANTLTVGGIAQTGGARVLTKTGAGTLVIDGASSYTGGTTINGGVLRFGTGAGTVPATGNFTIGSAGALAATGSAGFTTGALWLTSGRIATSSAGALALVADESTNFSLTSFSGLFIGAVGDVTYSGTLTPHATGGYRLGGGGGTLTVSSNLASTSAANATGALTVNGNVVLTGSNHYKGTTTVTSGLLTFSGLDQLGLNPAITLNGGGLQHAAGNTVDTSVRGITLGTNGGTIHTNGNGVTFANALGGTGMLIKTGAGTLTLDAARSGAGSTTVANGTLRLGVSNALGTTSALVLGSGTTAGTLNLDGRSQQVSTFAVSSNSNTAVNRLIISPGSTFTTTGNVTLGLDGVNTFTQFKAEGGGTWNATSSAASAAFVIGAGTGGSNYNTATADLSSLSRLNVQYSGATSIFRVGDSGVIASINNASTVTLARESLVQAARISIGGDAGSTVQHTLNLGAVSSLLYANSIELGAGSVAGDPRANGMLGFGFTTGTLVVRAQDGAGRAELRVISTESGSGNNMAATVNLTGHHSDLLLSTLTIARRTRNNGSGAATGLMTFDTGRLDATTVNIAHRIGAVGGANGAGTGTVAGTLNINGGDVDIGTLTMAFNSSDKTESTARSVAVLNISRGTVDVAGTLTGARHESTGNAAEGTINITGDAIVTVQQLNLAQATSSGSALGVLNVRNGTLNIGSGGLVLAGSAAVAGTASGTLNLTGGRVIMGGDISDAGGAGTSTSVLTLNGGSLDMGGNAIVGVDTLTWAGGALSNVASINGGAGLAKTTAGVLTLGGTNTWTGSTTLGAGTVVFSANENLGSTGSELIFGGGALRWAAGATADISSRTITFTTQARLDTNGNDVTLAGTIGNNGAGGLLKAGAGILTLQGGGLYGGGTIVRGGSLLLDFSGSSSGATRLGAGAVSLEGGSLLVLGTDAAGQTTTQTLGGVTLTAGASTIGVTAQATNAVTLNLGGLSRTVAGSTVNFTLPAAGEITTTTANASPTDGSQTILGGHATVGGTTWAVSGSGATAGTITGLTTYNTGFAAGTNVNATAGTSTPGAMTINSLRFSNAGSHTVNTGGAITIATGGILVTSGVGNIAINSNSLTSGNGQDLIIHQNNPGGTLTIASAITGSIGVTKSGTGTLVLSGLSTYTGSTIINEGRLTISRVEGASAGAASPLGAVPAATDADNIIINGGTLAANITVTLVAARGVQVGENGATLRHEAGRFWINGIIADLPGQAGVVTYEGSTAGGSDDLVLGGNNTYSGGTILAPNARVLTATNNAFGTGVLTFAGGRFRAGTGGDVTISNSYVFAANTTFHNPVVGQRSVIMPGNGILSGGDRTITVEATVTPAVMVTLSGSLGEDGSSRSLTKDGPGRLVLTGFNTYSGGTIIQGGVLQIGIAAGSTHTNADAALGAVPTTAATSLTFSGNGTLMLATNATTILAPTRMVAINSGVTATLDANGGNLTVLGQIIGAGAVKTGTSGTVVLASTFSTYAGGTTLEGGTLIIADDGSLGDGAGDVTVTASSTLQTLGDATLNAGRTLNLGTGAVASLSADGGTLTVSGQITGAGGLALPSSAGTVVLAGANNYTGGTTIGGATAGHAVLRATHAGALAGTSGISIGQAGGDDAARLELATGGTTTVSAPLTVTARTSTAAHVENVNGAHTLDGALTSTGDGQATFQSNAGELRLEFTAVTNTSSSVGLQGAGGGTVAADLYSAGSTGGLIKNGGGTWVITAAQSATGAVQVNNGTLLANNSSGSATGTGGVVVSGGTLGGTGSVGGDVLVNGSGAIRAGDAAVNGGIGTLNFGGNLELSGATADTDRLILQAGASGAADMNDAAGIQAAILGSNLASYLTSQAGVYEALNSGNHDRIVVAGNLTLEENAVLRFGRTDAASAYTLTPAFGDVYDLLDWGGLFIADGFTFGGTQRAGGLVGDLDLPTLGSGLSYDMSLFASNGIVVVVPEPGRALLVGAGLLLLGLRRRRR